MNNHVANADDRWESVHDDMANHHLHDGADLATSSTESGAMWRGVDGVTPGGQRPMDVDG